MYGTFTGQTAPLPPLPQRRPTLQEYIASRIFELRAAYGWSWQNIADALDMETDQVIDVYNEIVSGGQA